MMKPGKFTFNDQAHYIMVAAEEIVRKYKHSQLDIEHVLLALLEKEDGDTRDVLLALNADVEEIKRYLEQTIASFPQPTQEKNQILATPRMADFIVRADSEAKRLKEESISTECLLIAIVNKDKDQAAMMLSKFGISIEEVYRALYMIHANPLVTRPLVVRQSPALKLYGYELTETSRQDKFPPVTGRDSEVEQLIEILGKRTKNNPLLVADYTVDRFSVVDELARMIVTGNVPSFLQGKKVIALDLGKLIAGTKFRGEFEERVRAVLEGVTQSKGSVIPYFDDLFVGDSQGGLDLGSILKFPLSAGTLQCIAATLPKHLEYFEVGGLLGRYFQVISISKLGTTD